MTKTEQALKAKAEMQNLFQAAIDEQLAIIADAEQKLGELGYEGDSKPKKRVQREKNPDEPCKTCGFITSPPHDSRQHRSQDPKKPFTAKELEERGFKKRS